jgi:hypothetical protein
MCRRIVVQVVLWLGCILAGESSYADSTELTKRLSIQVQDIVTHKFDRDELFDCERFGHIASSNEDVLAAIGVAQLTCGDVVGAQHTEQLLRSKSPAHVATRACRDFVLKLAVVLALSRRTEAADSLLKWINEHDDAPISVCLTVARSLTRAGHQGEAKLWIERASRALESEMAKHRSGLNEGGRRQGSPESSGWAGHFVMHLISISKCQLENGEKDAARITRRRLEAIWNKSGKGSQFWLPSVLSLDWMLGDRSAAHRLVDDLRNGVSGSGTDGHQVVLAFLKMDDCRDALDAVSRVDSGWRNAAFGEIALYYGARAQLEQALDTVSRMDAESDIKEQLLVELAKAYARGGESKGGLAAIRKISNNVRRAQAILELAAIDARRGKVKSARQLVDGLVFLRSTDYSTDPNVLPTRRAFDLENPDTWCAPYTVNSDLGPLVLMRERQLAGDLLEAAVRCRVALSGAGCIVENPGMTKAWDVWKAASGQAGEGDLKGVFNWSDNLPRQRRVLALIGAASGCSRREKALGQAGKKEIHLSCSHSLIQRNGILFGVNFDVVCIDE